MSPISSETVANTPLAGHELAKLILADCVAMIESDCMLTSSVAYRRCSYELRLTLHMDNPAFALSESRFSSKKRSVQEIQADDSLAAVELHPLAQPTSEESFLSSTERHREMDSPNAVRIQQGLPIAVITRDSSGHHIEKSVQYPSDYADGALSEPVDKDVTEEESAKLGLTDNGSKRAKIAAKVETLAPTV